MQKLRLALLLALSCLAVFAATASTAEHHVSATLTPTNGSGVTGRVELTALPKGGTLITVVAQGLHAGTDYVSLYYDNSTCELEPYSADDVVGNYRGGDGGNASVTKKVDDDLDEIHSVSVRLAGSFDLQACASLP
jgi:hypothetical protein